MKRTIVVSEDGMFSSEPISVIEICNIFCAALTGAVQDIRPNYQKEKNARQIDKELFDALNYSFSKCLELTFPEYELHPELTEEILAKEDELLKEKIAAFPQPLPDVKEINPIRLEISEDDKKDFTEKEE